MDDSGGIPEALTENIDSLFSTALRLVGDRDIAGDLVQETAAKALRAGPGLRAQKRVRSWLFKILVNCVRDHMRRRRFWEEVEDEDSSIEVPCDLTAISRATSHDVRRALASLHPARRAVVVLVDIEDFTLSESADMLGIPPGTAASRLARARDDLRNLLEAYQPRISTSGGKL